MRIADFRARVIAQFGSDLKHATPANVREFLDQLQREMYQAEKAEQARLTGDPNAPYIVPDTPFNMSNMPTWESTIRDFFAKTLDMETERAFILLWILAFDMAYSGIEEIHATSMERLFKDMDGDSRA
jgi:hypothetical protein